MFDIIDKKIKDNKDVSIVGKVSEESILKAENILGVNFPKELREFYARYGCFTYKSHEIYGLGTDTYLNVVKATLKEREISNLPKNFILISNIAVDGLLIVINENGIIYEWMANGYEKKIAENLVSYLSEVIDN